MLSWFIKDTRTRPRRRLGFIAEGVGQLTVEKLQAGGKVRNPPYKPMYFRTHTKNCLSAAFLAEKVGHLPVEKLHGGWQRAQPALQAYTHSNP
jgi:predicted alpha/beta hydrolase family esterase